MSNSSLILVDQPGHVFETSDFGQRWVAGNVEQGLSVTRDDFQVQQVLVEFSFILPPLSVDEPGHYPIFTLANGIAGKQAGEPDFWFPGAGKGSGGFFLSINYEPCKGLLHCGMNAGTPKRQLQWIALGPAPADWYTGRVLRAFILIAPVGLYPSIEDVTGEQPELFGELELPRVAGACALPPWGVAPAGNWWVASGAEIKPDQGEKSLPPGFGLSDVRIHLLDPSDADFRLLPYSGDLDHLVESPEYTGDGPDDLADDEMDFEDEESLSDLLEGFASELTGLAGEANDWAGRALGLAEETDELAIRLAEELQEDEDDNYS